MTIRKLTPVNLLTHLEPVDLRQNSQTLVEIFIENRIRLRDRVIKGVSNMFNKSRYIEHLQPEDGRIHIAIELKSRLDDDQNPEWLSPDLYKAAICLAGYNRAGAKLALKILDIRPDFLTSKNGLSSVHSIRKSCDNPYNKHLIDDIISRVNKMPSSQIIQSR